MNDSEKVLDDKLRGWLGDLGLKVWTPAGAKEHLHLSSTPQQGGPVIDVIRPTNLTPFYIVGMGIGIHQSHQDSLRKMSTSERKSFINEIKYFLLEMELDVAFFPLNQEIPQVINVSKIVMMNGLKANKFLEAYYAVKNGGAYVLMRFAESFGNQAEKVDTKYG
ncbi:MAG: DUF2299 domain-containing protein [Metallosphaera sp.]|uniref:DUF2299 domain-containing protein n=1 Tax=Metallosphaera cuprina (strain Ar-4) TaxID=1006006 RepID=F4G2C8_METCR|nr:DUF2299 domain-containing protein [Metallosphaera cuprina]AEB94976.1 conserved hypothetical protein [Metallosphaera cuprina Ar-4]